MFVASGCECWNAPSTCPYTFGWQLDYIREGKILGNYIKQHFKGKKIGYFYQDDEFGQDGVKGLDYEIPKSQVVARESYDPTNTNIGPQVTALKAAGAQVVVSFSVPAFTALLQLISLKLSFSPQLVVSDVGSDPITLAGLLEAFAKQGGATVSGNALTQGIITDGYLPSLGDTSNSWIQLFTQDPQPVHPEAADGRQRGLRHGGRLHVRAGHVQGRAQPDPAGPGQRDQRRPAAGRLGGALRLLVQRPRRHHRRLHGRDQERRARPDRAGPGHRQQPDRGDHDLHHARSRRRRPAGYPRPDARGPAARHPGGQLACGAEPAPLAGPFRTENGVPA